MKSHKNNNNSRRTCRCRCRRRYLGSLLSEVIHCRHQYLYSLSSKVANVTIVRRLQHGPVTVAIKISINPFLPLPPKLPRVTASSCSRSSPYTFPNALHYHLGPYKTSLLPYFFNPTFFQPIQILVTQRTNP